MGIDTWAYAAVLTPDVYDAFERRAETLVVALALNDAYNIVGFQDTHDDASQQWHCGWDLGRCISRQSPLGHLRAQLSRPYCSMST